MKNTKTNIKLYTIIAFIISCIFYFPIAYLGNFNHDYKLVIGSIVYFLGTYFALKFIKAINNEAVFGIIIFPPAIIFILFNIIQFKHTLISLPSSIFLILSCISAYFFFKGKKYIFPFLLILTGIFWMFFGQPLLMNKINYGSFSKNINIKMPYYSLYDTAKEKVLLNSHSKKIILDFWFSGCVPCFQLFPYIDSINKILDTNKYKILVVNIPLTGQNVQTNYTLLDRFHYNFTKLFASDDSLLHSLNLQSFPTTIIIENDNIIYKGDFESAIERLK